MMLSGRNAVVTGGERGIGAAIVRKLRADGAEVTSWDLDSDPPVDVCDGRSLADAAKRAGRIDILVCNAGIAGPTGPLETYPDDMFRKIVDIDLVG
ncbi:MAG: SDR family oxidoreductase, partial [Geminicoccaceae bacterium]|nr:SDR family oxidoreductase [Geminicoccaceae bacterium]